MKEAIRSDGAPSPIGPYSQGLKVRAETGSQLVTLYCAGQVGANPQTGALVEGIEAQTKRCLDNLAAVLEGSGMSMKNVVKTSVFMVDLSQFSRMNDEYAKAFTPPYPARSTVQVSALPKGGLVEIDAVAVKD